MTLEIKANRLREAVDTYRKLDDTLTSYEHNEFELWVESLIETAEVVESKGKLSWLGKSCKDCGNEKCKKLGTLPKGYDCALWQAESEE